MAEPEVTEEQAEFKGTVTEHPVDKDQTSFLASCDWLRDRHILAFIMGLFTLGIPYSMAGIGGADPSTDHVPLVQFWSSGKVKWIATISLLGELYFLFTGFGGALKASVWAFWGLPIVVVLALAVTEVLYEVFAKSDGFKLTQLHTFDREDCLPSLEGPALLAHGLVRTLPQPVRATLGLLWAWLIGFIYVATFFAGIALVVTLGLIIIGIIVTFFVIGLFMDKGEVQVRPDSIPDIPPIPLDGLGIQDAQGTLIVFRRAGRLYQGKKQVGYAKGKTLYVFSIRAGIPHPVYEIRRDEILELPSARSYGKFDDSAIYWPDGTVRDRFVEVK